MCSGWLVVGVINPEPFLVWVAVGGGGPDVFKVRCRFPVFGIQPRKRQQYRVEYKQYRGRFVLSKQAS